MMHTEFELYLLRFTVWKKLLQFCSSQNATQGASVKGEGKYEERDYWH